MSPGWLAVGAAGLLLGALAWTAPAQGELEPGILHEESPGEQLAIARGLKRRLGEVADALVPSCRERAVAAYRAVRLYHPAATRIGAEAAFRAGQLLAAGDREEEAIGEFEVARALGRGTEFRARSGLEVARLHERSGRHARALDALFGVLADPEAADVHRDQAWMGAARAWIGEGRLSDARRAWLAVCEHAQNPLERVRAYDELGLSWLEHEGPEAAAGVLDECLRALSPVALEKTEQGDKVRRALRRMRLVRALTEAIRERYDSSQARGSPRKS